MSMEQGSRGPMTKDLIPDEIGKLIWVAREVTNQAKSETAVLLNYNGSGIMCGETHSNLKRRQSSLITR